MIVKIIILLVIILILVILILIKSNNSNKLNNLNKSNKSNKNNVLKEDFTNNNPSIQIVYHVLDFDNNDITVNREKLVNYIDKNYADAIFVKYLNNIWRPHINWYSNLFIKENVADNLKKNKLKVDGYSTDLVTTIENNFNKEINEQTYIDAFVNSVCVRGKQKKCRENLTPDCKHRCKQDKLKGLESCDCEQQQGCFVPETYEESGLGNTEIKQQPIVQECYDEFIETRKNKEIINEINEELYASKGLKTTLETLLQRSYSFTNNKEIINIYKKLIDNDNFDDDYIHIYFVPALDHNGIQKIDINEKTLYFIGLYRIDNNNNRVTKNIPLIDYNDGPRWIADFIKNYKLLENLKKSIGCKENKSKEECVDFQETCLWLDYGVCMDKGLVKLKKQYQDILKAIKELENDTDYLKALKEFECYNNRIKEIYENDYEYMDKTVNEIKLEGREICRKLDSEIRDPSFSEDPKETCEIGDVCKFVESSRCKLDLNNKKLLENIIKKKQDKLKKEIENFKKERSKHKCKLKEKQSDCNSVNLNTLYKEKTRLENLIQNYYTYEDNINKKIIKKRIAHYKSLLSKNRYNLNTIYISSLFNSDILGITNVNIEKTDIIDILNVTENNSVTDNNRDDITLLQKYLIKQYNSIYNNSDGSVNTSLIDTIQKSFNKPTTTTQTTTINSYEQNLKDGLERISEDYIRRDFYDRDDKLKNIIQTNTFYYNPNDQSMLDPEYSLYDRFNYNNLGQFSSIAPPLTTKPAFDTSYRSHPIINYQDKSNNCLYGQSKIKVGDYVKLKNNLESDDFKKNKYKVIDINYNKDEYMLEYIDCKTEKVDIDTLGKKEYEYNDTLQLSTTVPYLGIEYIITDIKGSMRKEYIPDQYGFPSDDTDDELSYDNRIFTLKDKCLAKENQKYSINDIVKINETTYLDTFEESYL